MKQSLVKIGFLDSQDIYLEDIKRKNVEVITYKNTGKKEDIPRYFEVNIFCKKMLTFVEQNKTLKDKRNLRFIEDDKTLKIIIENKDINFGYSKIDNFYIIYCEEVIINPEKNTITCN